MQFMHLDCPLIRVSNRAAKSFMFWEKWKINFEILHLNYLVRIKMEVILDGAKDLVQVIMDYMKWLNKSCVLVYVKL